MDTSADFSSFQEKVTAALIKSTQTVKKISDEDVDFHRTSSTEFAENLDEQSSRLLSLTSSLLKVATGGTDIKAPVLEDEDAIEDNWRGIVDVIDNLLEKADACLDEFTGIIKKLSPPQQDRIREASTRQQEKKFPTIYDYGPSKIPKPQLQFRIAPNNHDTSPFRPLLKSKPHAIVPLEKSLQLVETEKKPALYVIIHIIHRARLTIHIASQILTKKRSAMPSTPSQPTSSRRHQSSVLLKPQKLSGSILPKEWPKWSRNSKKQRKLLSTWNTTMCIHTMD